MPFVTMGLIGYYDYTVHTATEWTNSNPTTSSLPLALTNVTFDAEGAIFNGTSSRASVSGYPNAPAFTYEAYVKVEDTGAMQAIISLFSTTTRRGAMKVQMSNDTFGYEDHTGANRAFTDAGSIPTNRFVHLAITYHSFSKELKTYIDGQPMKVYSYTGGFVGGNFHIGAKEMSGVFDTWFKGKIKYVRWYNVELTPEQVLQNSQSSEIIAPDNPPIATVTNIDKRTISRNIGEHEAVIQFSFDKDVQQYTVRVGGVDHTTGYEGDSGGAKTAGTTIYAVIDGNELQTEGDNRVNIYGQGNDGKWSPYES